MSMNPRQTSTATHAIMEYLLFLENNSPQQKTTLGLEMVMCVLFITPCTFGIPHDSLNSSIFCPTSHAIRLLNMIF